MNSLRKLAIRIGLSLWAIKTGSKLIEYIENGRKGPEAKAFVDSLIKPFEQIFKKGV